MKTILVTGGAGYIGSHVVKMLGEAGYEVIVYDDLSTGHEWAVLSGRMVRGNINDTVKLQELLQQYNIDAVIHFAAHIIVPESVGNPLKYYLNNVMGTLNLLNVLKQCKIDKFIFSSTAAVYGIPSIIPVAEETPLSPINPYGRGKAMIEQVLSDLSFSNEIDYVTLRYFNVAGADPAGRIGEGKPDATHLITMALRTAAGLCPHLDVFGTDYPTFDGTCIRDYIHVVDLASAHLKALEYLFNGGKSDVFNCGYGKGYSVLEVITAAKEITGNNFQVNYTGRRPGDPPVLIADCEKIGNILSWQPSHNDLHHIIETAWNWEKTRIARYNG